MKQSINIFVCTFDKEVRIHNDIFVPLQVGRKASPVKFDYLSDDTGDNISEKNKYYSEQTGVYWVWKNMCENHPDYVGFCHYEKYPYFGKWSNATEFSCSKDTYESTGMNESSIYDTVGKCDFVCINPFYYGASLESVYRRLHISEDFDILDAAVRTMFPEYYPSFEFVMKKDRGAFFPFNAYVTRWDLFCEYCEFIFPLFEYMENLINKNIHTGYQSRVFGYMAERLLSVFIHKSAFKTFVVPCARIEGYDRPDYSVQDR